LPDEAIQFVHIKNGSLCCTHFSGFSFVGWSSSLDHRSLRRFPGRLCAIVGRSIDATVAGLIRANLPVRLENLTCSR
jgi:hypothetical protein